MRVFLHPGLLRLVRKGLQPHFPPCLPSSVRLIHAHRSISSRKPSNGSENASRNLEEAASLKMDIMHNSMDAELSDSDSDVDSEDSISAEDEEIMGKKWEEVWQNLSLKDVPKMTMGKEWVREGMDDSDEDENGKVPQDRQQSLRVGILGPANAGKSSLTNYMVGTKVAAVSRKRNTTLSDVLGVITKGNKQILLYDTPGLVLDVLGHPSKNDVRRRSESAWHLVDHCEVLIVLIDSYRQMMKPDKRILRLVERMGKEENPNTKQVLCFNKVDIIKKKSDLLPFVQQFGNLPGFESIFMISALTGSGVKQLEDYLMNQTILRPWDEDPNPLNEEVLKTLSLEIVREHLLHHVHEEIPYELDHQLVDWDEREDGSLRIEQHLYLPKKSQCRILVGKGGSKIREIGIAACEELRKLMGKNVHLFLEVKHVPLF